MTTKQKRWTTEHFSQTNPAGPGQDDVPALLRRVAKTIEKIGPIEVRDLILHTDMNDDGFWHSLTVYFDRLPASPAKNRKTAKHRTRK